MRAFLKDAGLRLTGKPARTTSPLRLPPFPFRLSTGFIGTIVSVSLRDLVEDGAQGRRRIRCPGDGAAYDKVIGATGQCLARRRHALLVVFGGRRRPHPRRHQEEALAELPAQRRRLLRRAYDPV